MRIKHVSAALVVALLAVSGLAACGDDDDNGNGGGAAAPASTTGAEETGGQIDPSKPEVRLALIGIDIPGIELLPLWEKGAKAAVENINGDGGFGGRRVVLDVCNSQAQPAVANTCARRTVAKNPIAQFGCEISWAQGGLQIYAREEIPSFNCTNTEEDFTNPWSYGIHPGGAERARSRYACARDDVQKLVVITQDIPQQRQVSEAMRPLMEECDKELTFVYYPIAAADLTPVVQRAVREDPDAIFVNTTGPQAVTLVRDLASNGISGEQIWMGESSWNYNDAIKPMGDAIEGAYYIGGWKGWDDTSNSDMADYFAAMEAAGIDRDEARDPSLEYGFAEVMFFYAAAKEIGFDRFDSATLKEFADSTTDFDMPLSRALVNPGPEGYPQVKQPYVQIAQWRDDKLTPVSGEGTEEGGWVLAF